MSEKTWGGEPFWGLGYDWDPDWVLTDRQKELREVLIELCEKEMRANAKISDDELKFPRRNLELLGEHGFLALTVPEEYGGLGAGPRRLRDDLRDDRAVRLRLDRDVLRDAHGRGQHDHAAPDPGADRQVHPPAEQRQDRHAVLLRPGDRVALLVPDLLRRRARQRWLPGQQEGVMDDVGWLRRLLRRPDDEPDFTGYDDLSVFVIDGDAVQSQPSTWDALGLRGNQSGPIQVENVEIPGEQIVGPVGDGAASNDEAVDPWFLLGSSSVWNGLALGAIDIAKRQTTRKRHVDVGLRVADYPTIQDYVGEAVMDTNACRLFAFSVAQAMDQGDRPQHLAAAPRRVRARELPALGVADQVRGGQEHGARRRQDAPRLAAARATSATWRSSATCVTPRPAG